MCFMFSSRPRHVLDWLGKPPPVWAGLLDDRSKKLCPGDISGPQGLSRLRGSKHSSSWGQGKTEVFDSRVEEFRTDLRQTYTGSRYLLGLSTNSG